MKRTCLLGIGLALALPTAGLAKSPAKAPKVLTRAELLKGCPVPEKREFPLNTDVNPCDNFYEYACSKVRDAFTLPADRSSWDFAFSDAAERILYAKKNFFREIDKGYVPEKEGARQTRDYYQACMNPKAQAAEEKSRVASEKKIILGLKTPEELADLLQKRIDTADDSFENFSDIPNQADPKFNDLILDIDARTLPERSYYEKADLMKDFEALALDFFKTIKADQPEQRAKWVVSFEKELAEKIPLPKDLRDRFTQDTYFDAAAWKKTYPLLKFDRILAKFPEKTKLRRFVPEAFDYFEDALQHKPLEQLKSVYLFHALHGLMDDAYPQFYAKKFELAKKYLGGPEKRPDRQERCTKETMGAFEMEVDQELVPILFPNFPADRVTSLVEKTRASLVDTLDRNDYLSKEAKAEAKRKISSASLFLVQPQRAEDWNFHLPAKYDPKKPLSNRRLYAEKAIEKTLKELPDARNRSRWDMGPLTLNAYYDPTDNKFVLLQGILQAPFFDPTASELDNLGAIGSVTGHELGHSIDDQGSQFDSEGKIRKWMSDKDSAEFHKRSGKFVELFNQAGHDGRLTLGENIGDHVGITAAYHAAFPEGSKPTPPEQQRFFLGWAHAWCNKARPTFEEKQLKTNPHALGWARVNEQVIQLPGFAQAYSCKAGNKMYVAPKDQIHVW